LFVAFCQILSQTYSFQDFKIDCEVPTGAKDPSLPMDKYDTVKKIKKLFGMIDKQLASSIAISDA
jgi:hypothetical protein